MGQAIITKLVCYRCNYIWVPRKAKVRACPYCQRRDWDSTEPAYPIRPNITNGRDEAEEARRRYIL